MHNRRKTLVFALAGASGALLASAAHAQDAVLQETEKEARAIHYVADANRVDATKFPAYKRGQTCANCSLYLGDKGEKFGPCNLFFGKQVAAAGWCSSWDKQG